MQFFGETNRGSLNQCMEVTASHAMRQFTIILESKGTGEAQRFFVWVVSGVVDAQSFEQHRATAERIIGPAFRQAAEFSADSTERVLTSSGASVQRITLSHEKVSHNSA